MKNAIAVGTVHPYLTIKEVNDFVDSYNQQTIRDIQLLLFVDGNISLNCFNVLKKIKAPLKIVHDDFVPRGMGFHLQKMNTLLNTNIEYVFRVDLDDILVPLRFEHQLEYMNNNKEIDIMSGACKVIDSDDIYIPPLTNKRILNYIMFCPIVHPAVCLRWKSIKFIGGYKNLSRNQDLDLWLRCAANGLKFANTNKVLINYKRTKKHKTVLDIFSIIKMYLHFYKKLNYSELKLLQIIVIFLVKETIPINLKNNLRNFFSENVNKK